ncbi:MAG: glycosyltransferase family 9 protein [Caulobacterales bacterium]
MSGSASRNLMTGRYLARNRLVVAAMAAADAIGNFAPRRFSPIPVGKPLRVLVSDLAHLGDLVALAPVIGRLRSSPRISHVGLLIGSWGRPVAEIADLADEIHIFDHAFLNRGGEKRFDRHVKTRADARFQISEARYDVAIDAYPYLGNAAGLLWSASVPARIGFTSGGAGSFYTHRVRFDPAQSLLVNQARLLEPVLGSQADLRAMLPGFRPDFKIAGELAEVGPYVVFHIGPGASHKDWPADAWIALGRSVRKAGYELVFTGGPSERDHGARVRQALGGKDLVGAAGLAGFATALRDAAGLVTIDTVAGHLAACFETPTVVVYPGIAPPSFWKPAQRFVRLATYPTLCAPCHLTRGCEAMTCIRDLTADDAMATLASVIAEKQADQPVLARSGN